MSRRKLAVSALLVFIVAGVIMYYCLFPSDPAPDIQLENDGNIVRFVIDVSSINSVTGFTVYSRTKEEQLWYVAPLDSGQRILVYGNKPQRALVSNPVDGRRPRKLEDGEEIFLAIGIQYDEQFAPTMVTRYYYFVYSASARNISCARVSRKDTPYWH